MVKKIYTKYSIEPTYYHRLLELLPCSTLTEIQCKFHIYPTSGLEAVDYVAVSYRWGKDDKTQPPKTITFDGGSKIEVRSAVWHFLSTMREAQMWGLYFVDSICINQASKKEKGEQVACMNSIYAMSNLVVVWLGHPEITRRATWGGPGSHKGSHKGEDRDAGSFLPVLERFLARQNPYEDLANDDVPFNEVLAFDCVFANEYWSRLWIVQEILLARNITVYCGNCHWDWDTLARASPHALRRIREDYSIRDPRTGRALTYHEHELEQAALGSPYGYAMSIFNEKSKWKRRYIKLSQLLPKQWPLDARYPYAKDFFKVEGMSLYQAFRNFAAQRCEEPRDKLYSLYGILYNPPMEPDYSVPVSLICKTVIDCSLRRLDTLRKRNEPVDETDPECCQRIIRSFPLSEDERSELNMWVEHRMSPGMTSSTEVTANSHGG
jgi:hypothetical protein